MLGEMPTLTSDQYTPSRETVATYAENCPVGQVWHSISELRPRSQTGNAPLFTRDADQHVADVIHSPSPLM